VEILYDSLLQESKSHIHSLQAKKIKMKKSSSQADSAKPWERRENETPSLQP
jgi:hypothetical protein